MDSVEDPIVNVNLYINGVYIIAIVVGCIGVLVLSQYSFFVYAFILVVAIFVFLYIYATYQQTPKVRHHGHSHTSSSSSTNTGTPEVFHIANNLFTYKDAQKVCSAYNGRLATFEDMNKAYQKGANWCTYGWSDDQNVFYSTQQATYDKLKSMPGHEHDCGHPGVNGGYIEDNTILFGVNCYGIKPEPTEDELALMKVMESTPQTDQDIDMENDLSYWQQNRAKLLLYPFNASKWHMYTRV